VVEDVNSFFDAAIKERYSTLKDKITKNRIVWKAISESLQNLQSGITLGQCAQEWRNLQQQYKKYIDNNTKTGRARVSKPEFFDEIEEVIGSSHTVNPQHITDTEQSTASSILDTSTVDRVDEEERGHRSHLLKNPRSPV